MLNCLVYRNDLWSRNTVTKKDPELEVLELSFLFPANDNLQMKWSWNKFCRARNELSNDNLFFLLIVIIRLENEKRKRNAVTFFVTLWHAFLSIDFGSLTIFRSIWFLQQLVFSLHITAVQKVKLLWRSGSPLFVWEVKNSTTM